MPHFSIEYSANLDERLDMAEVCEIVRKAAGETGIFPIGGIRVRAIRCEHYAIADGKPDYGFLAMLLRLGEGRDRQDDVGDGEANGQPPLCLQETQDPPVQTNHRTAPPPLARPV